MTASLDLTQVWVRKVHVRVTLAGDEVTSPDAPKPVVEWVPFYSNTDHLARILYQHFKYCISPSLEVHKSGEPWERAWFEYKQYKIPGRQVPIGILAHAHVPENERPWRLTVHFAGYPDECCPFKATTRKLDLKHMYFNPKHMFFNSLKEAFVIMTGKANAIMSLLVAQQEAIWKAASEGDYAKHTQEMAALPHQAARRRERTSIDVPIRVLRCASPDLLPGKVPDARFFSRPAVAQRSDGTHPTLLDTLFAIVPDIFDDVTLSGPPAASTAPTAAESGPAASSSPGDDAMDVDSSARSQPLLVARHSSVDTAPSISGAVPEAQQSGVLDVEADSSRGLNFSAGGDAEGPVKEPHTPADCTTSASGGDEQPQLGDAVPPFGESPVEESSRTSDGDASTGISAAPAGKDATSASTANNERVADADSAAVPASPATEAGEAASEAPMADGSARWLPEPTSPMTPPSRADAVSEPLPTLPPVDEPRHVPQPALKVPETVKPAKVTHAVLKEGVVVRVAGCRVPLEAPVAVLYEYFRAPDCFLYVTVHTALDAAP